MFLYNLIFKPIEIIIGFAYVFSENMFPLLGAFGNVFFVSIVVNLIALPLYNKAESLQKVERDKSTLLKPMVDKIKKAFKGNERFMILNEYYRQNSYHPLYALRSSLSILIEIPIFIAAYHYLSNILPYDKDFFWILKDSSVSDGMLKITLFNHALTINILPIIMTAINFISGYIYTKNSTRREKIQVYVLGLIFLVLLYNSPSGLVFYWILNNVFSLVKNIVLTRSKKPKKWLLVYVSVVVLIVSALMVFHAWYTTMRITYGKTSTMVVLTLGIILFISSLFYKTKFGKVLHNEMSGFFAPSLRVIKNVLSIEKLRGGGILLSFYLEFV